MKIVDKQGNEYDYDESRIVKFRSCSAYGADDLSNWSSRRVVGRAGAFSRKDAKKERKRALELSKKSGKTVRAFDSSLQSARKTKKRPKKKLTPHQLYRKQRRKLLSLRRSKGL